MSHPPTIPIDPPHTTVDKDRSTDASETRSSNIHRFSSISSSSTTRYSVASSILSRTLSTASTALSRYSSVRSSAISASAEPIPSSPTALWILDKGKEATSPSPCYWCTLCSAAFHAKDDWRAHEEECHERTKSYTCTDCQAVYLQLSQLTHHRRDAHGRSARFGTEINAVHTSVRRNAWGCGFCASFLPSLPDYLDHISQHYDEGRGLCEWRHSFVIRALLHQPGVKRAWKAIVARNESVAGNDDTFLWDPKLTGRSIISGNPDGKQSLQDLLEFFTASQMRPQAIVKAAYDLACVTASDHVEDTTHDISVRINLDTMPPAGELDAGMVSGPKPLEVSSPIPLSTNDDGSPPLIAPTPAITNAPRKWLPETSYHLPPPVSVRTEGPITPSTVFVKIEKTPGRALSSSVSGSVEQFPSAFSLEPQPRRGLRRIDSDRYLVVTRTVESSSLSGVQSLTGQTVFEDASTMPEHPISMSGTPRPSATLESVTETKALTFSERNEISSLRSHSNSSAMSTNTVGNTTSREDSASDVLSNDSVSEPDIWFNDDGNSAASKEWIRSYQHAVDGVMEHLWLQYNQDWDTMIRGHTGGGSSNHSRGRGKANSMTGNSCNLGPGGGLRRHGTNRIPNEGDDDDDEINRNRPSTSSTKPSSAFMKRFVCPFRKHDPQTYNLHDHQICVVHTWPTIPRLKEHLYRKHYRIHCQRCKQTFSGPGALDDHEMAPDGCVVRNVIPPSDITTAQERQLKSKKNTTKHLRDEEKWAKIYQLLFPQDQVVPSPYPEYTEDLGPISPESRNSLSFQHYLLRQMPDFFRLAAEEYLGRHLQAEEGLSMEATPAIIEVSLRKAFSDWESANELGDNIPSLPLQSSGSFTAFTTTNLSAASQPSPPSSIPPWMNSTVSQISASAYASTTMESTTSWASASQPLAPEVSGSGDYNWLSSRTPADLESYQPFYVPGSGLRDPIYTDSLCPTTNNHDESYTSHDYQMGEQAFGSQSYF